MSVAQVAGGGAGLGRLLPMPISVSASDSCPEQLETNLWHRAAQPWKESTGKVIFTNLEL